MKLRVRGELVFIRPDQRPTETESGLQLVYDQRQTADRGVVIAVGDGPVTSKGVRLPHIVQPGDKVLFPPDAGSEVLCTEDTLIAMRETEILAVIEG